MARQTRELLKRIIVEEVLREDAKETAATIKKMKRDLAGSFVTLYQINDAIKSTAFQSGANVVYRDMDALKRDMTTMYKRLEGHLKQLEQFNK